MATMKGEILTPGECPTPGCPHTAYSSPNGSEVCHRGEECPLHPSKKPEENKRRRVEHKPKDWTERVGGYTFTFNYDDASGDMLIYDEEGDQVFRLFGAKWVREGRAWAAGYNAGRQHGKLEGIAEMQFKARRLFGMER